MKGSRVKAMFNRRSVFGAIAAAGAATVANKLPTSAGGQYINIADGTPVGGSGAPIQAVNMQTQYGTCRFIYIFDTNVPCVIGCHVEDIGIWMEQINTNTYNISQTMLNSNNDNSIHDSFNETNIDNSVDNSGAFIGARASVNNCN
jgi:hypothetical protein